MRRLGEGDVTKTLIDATEKAEGAEHVIVIMDSGSKVKVICDGELTIAEAVYNLEVAKAWLIGDVAKPKDE